MRLLITTQKVDQSDPVLGFFHRWIIEIAKHVDSIIVVCLFKGEYDLPENVEVVSLGKEVGETRSGYVRRFFSIIWKRRSEYDSVLVHMNPEYVVLGGVLWRMLGKKISLWYTHKNVDLKLQIAVILAHTVFTASSESLRMATSKKTVMGHAIDVDHFLYTARVLEEPFILMTVGRVTPSKHILEMIEVVRVLKKQGLKVQLRVVGAPQNEEEHAYHDMLEHKLAQFKMESDVVCVGAVRHDELVEHLPKAHVFLNLSVTGSLDKAVLEAMSSGVPVVTANEGLKSALEDVRKDCFVASQATSDIADAVKRILEMDRDRYAELCKKVRGIVIRDHGMRSLIRRLCEAL